MWLPPPKRVLALGGGSEELKELVWDGLVADEFDPGFYLCEQ